jgi:hypothetical protein
MRFWFGLFLVATAHAAELKPATLRAWEQYVQSAASNLQTQVATGGAFLRIDAAQDAVNKVHSGEILVGPGHSESTKKVPSGLIHDWVGTAFIPGTNLDTVLSVLRSYEQYKDFYSPTVVDSKTIAKSSTGDRFSMILMNNSFFVKTAFESDYSCSSVRVSEQRSYIVCESTQFREIKQYGTPDQRMLPEGEGSGVIWRLFSITRLEEHDGGVYMELEAMALSREIPFALHWMVEPIVHRVSRNSLIISLKQTEGAVHSTVASANSSGAGDLSWAGASVGTGGHKP